MTDAKAKILYVDDSKERLQEVASVLRDEFNILTSDNPLRASEFVRLERPSLILLDVYMPFQDGLMTYKKIRELPGSEGRTPVIFISSDEQDNTVTTCFGLGAADFVFRSFTKAQLIARIKSKLSQKDKMITISPHCYLNSLDGNLYFNEKCVGLTPNEFRLLSFTVESGFVIDKKELIKKVWADAIVLDKTINTHLTNLRKKIAECDFTVLIQRNGNVCIELKRPL